MKTNSNFKMPKELKRMLLSTGNTQRRAETQSLFIQAEATYLENRNRRSKEKINLGDE